MSLQDEINKMKEVLMKQVSFKQFIIEMHKICKELVANPKRSYKKNPERYAK